MAWDWVWYLVGIESGCMILHHIGSKLFGLAVVLMNLIMTSREVCVVVVYHVTTVAGGHGMLNKFWPLVIDCVLRTAGNSYRLLCRPAYFVRTTWLFSTWKNDVYWDKRSSTCVMWDIWIRIGSDVDSIKAAMLTVSPNTEKCGIYTSQKMI